MHRRLSRELAERHRDKQRPEVVILRHVDLIAARGHKEASPCRQDHVFRLDPPSQLSRQPTAGQRSQASHVSPYKNRRGMVISSPPGIQQHSI